MRVFPDDAGFCPVDGNALQFASMVPVTSNDEDPRIGTKLCDPAAASTEPQACPAGCN